MHTRIDRLRIAVVVALVLAVPLAALVATVPVSRANHDTISWSTFFTVADQTGIAISNGYPTMLADGKGYFYVFYLRRDPGTGTNSLWVQKWQDRGPFGVPALVSGSTVRVNPTGTQPAYSSIISFGSPAPSAAIDSNGNLYVAWTTKTYQIYVSKSTDGGKTWPVQAQASPTLTVGTAWFDLPSITALTNGTVYVAFEQIFIITPTNFFGNVTTAFSTDGTTYRGYTNASGQANPHTALFASVNLVSDAHGRLFLAYSNIASFSAFYANWTWSDSGLLWAAPKPFNGGVAQAYLPSMVVDAAGHVHAAWVDTRSAPNGNPTIWYVESTDRGAAWTIPMPVSHGMNYPFFPTVTSLGSNVMIAWAGNGGLGYAVSADGGSTFYPEQQANFGPSVGAPTTAIDENGTVYAAFTDTSGTYDFTGFVFWDGPPSPPANVAIAPSGATGLTVSWPAPPEKDVVQYRVWRSADGGASYQLIATVGAATLSYTDTGLTNGTYWYKVTAVDYRGTSSHDSVPEYGNVGLTTAQMIANLQSQIASLQAEVNSLQSQLTTVNATLSAQLTAAQNQITLLQNQITAVQNSDSANAAALQNLKNQLTSLQGNVTNLQNALNQARSEQATQTISYVNMGFEILVVVLLALILIMQMRKPKNPMSLGSMQAKKPGDEL